MCLTNKENHQSLLLLSWPRRRFKVPCGWRWCIAMSFSCERQRNIITLTLDFHFPWIISFLFPFQEHISSFSTTEENYIIPVMMLTTKLWFTVERKHETCLKYALWKSPTVHCNHTAWQAAISILLSATTQTMTTVQSVCWTSFNICWFFCHMCCDSATMWKSL